MKRLLSLCLLSVILFAGVTSINISNCIDKDQSGRITNSIHKSPESSCENNRFYISSSDFHLLGFGNEQIRLSFSSQNAPLEIFSVSDSLRITYSRQLEALKFQCTITSFLLQSARTQLNGYYLYQLRKLLI
jgi:hypothetical protein